MSYNDKLKKAAGILPKHDSALKAGSKVDWEVSTAQLDWCPLV